MKMCNCISAMFLKHKNFPSPVFWHSNGGMEFDEGGIANKGNNGFSVLRGSNRKGKYTPAAPQF